MLLLKRRSGFRIEYELDSYLTVAFVPTQNKPAPLCHKDTVLGGIIRILLFSSVTFNMTTKDKVFLLVDGKIRSRIRIRTNKLRIRMRIQAAQKHRMRIRNTV
jgi:hypothetical protein